nr:DsbA family protein [Pullulanibacillus camelliae]
MLLYSDSSTCEGSSNQSCSISNTVSKKTKPIEVYAFVNPICPESWGMEPNMKKLVAEYGQYFTMRIILGYGSDHSEKSSQWGKTAQLSGMSFNEHCHEVKSCYRASLAVKAAELQGKCAGERFLRILRERLFIDTKDINSDAVLNDCAKRAKLDLGEFKNDMESSRPIKGLQCDRRITNEMDVNEFPTLVFFNIRDDNEGIKVAGRYPYNVYVQILTETLGKQPEKQSPPKLEDFLKKHRFLATQEIALVYDKEKEEVLKELKKLRLKQVVSPVHVKHGTFWRYINTDD